MPEIDWPEKARDLAVCFPLERFPPGVRERLNASPTGSVWGIACSGGADSVCLVLLLFAHFPGRCRDLRVLHFDHRLRGRDSREDAVAVESLARGLGLACRLGVWEDAPVGGASAEASRAARFGFFQKVLADEEASLLLLGHQRDDIVESQLMGLSRGGATAALAAPRPVSASGGTAVRLRPLLELGADEIRQALRDLAIPWREDASNASENYYRNRVRHAVLPVWREVSPFDVSRGAAASRALLEEDDAALEEWVDRVMEALSFEQGFPAAPLRTLPKAVCRRALNRWLATEGLKGNLTAAAFEELLAAVGRREPFRRSAGRQDFLCFDGAFLRREGTPGDVRPWAGEVFCPAGAELRLPGGRGLRVTIESLDAAKKAAVLGGKVDPGTEAVFDAGRIEGDGVWVRLWREGDRYRPLGAPGERKLQDMFTDRKIGTAERGRLPVVCTYEGVILWCPGLPPVDTMKVGKSTKRVVRLTYSGGGPT